VDYATGDVLSAGNMNDLSGTVNLLESAQFAAGKNKIINGDFSVNQRNFTSVAGGFGFDRFIYATSGSTGTYSSQTFTPGTAPVAGYEGKNFARLAITTGADFGRINQNIESVRTLAGQTATLSFWAKGTNPTTPGNLQVRMQQFFGTGGSPSAAVPMTEQSFVLTANWTRYSFIFAVPSISGKTLGTNNDDALQVDFGQLSPTSTDAWTLDLWGVQLEAGSTASAFQTSTGTIQGELAACQRYYWRENLDTFVGGAINGFSTATTSFQLATRNPVAMRVGATAVDFSALRILDTANSAYSITNITLLSSATNKTLSSEVTATISGGTAGRWGMVQGNGTGYLGFSAEL